MKRRENYTRVKEAKPVSVRQKTDGSRSSSSSIFPFSSPPVIAYGVAIDRLAKEELLRISGRMPENSFFLGEIANDIKKSIQHCGRSHPPSLSSAPLPRPFPFLSSPFLALLMF